jgi:hypothetical protein
VLSPLARENSVALDLIADVVREDVVPVRITRSRRRTKTRGDEAFGDLTCRHVVGPHDTPLTERPERLRERKDQFLIS